jgi:nicotinamide riboside transporter PnuC
MSFSPTSPLLYSVLLAGNITLIAGAVVMIPTTLTGWFTWKSRYKGAKVPLFKRKISIAFGMMVYSIALIVWRLVFYNITSDLPNNLAHWFYLIALGLLPLGAALEGYYGGKLNHR